MRQFFSVSLAVLGVACVSARGSVLSFSDQSLPANSFNNGGPVTNSTGFNSNGFYLNNDYDSDFGGFWDGWVLSNVNNTGSDYPGVGDSAGNHEYAAYPGSGVGGTNAVYAVNYGGGYISLPAGQIPVSVDLTNDTYTALSMLYGDGFAKQFGPTDYFDITLTGYTGAGGTGATTGSTTFYLAQDGSIVNTWVPVDLTALGDASSIGFSYGSSDAGTYGINTPTYVALDDLTTAAVPEPASVGVMSLIAIGSLARRRRTRAM
jgi:hypothetical protein